MNNLSENILQDLYQNKSNNGYITIDEFVTLYGLSGELIKSELEQLKDDGLIVEHEEGYKISTEGQNAGMTKWI